MNLLMSRGFVRYDWIDLTILEKNVFDPTDGHTKNGDVPPVVGTKAKEPDVCQQISMKLRVHPTWRGLLI